MGKSLALMLLLLIALSSPSLLVVNTASAQTISKPSVPQFSIKFMNASYTVTETNSYTGQKETQLVNNNTIEVAIDNQPWKYPDYKIYYNIRVKPHFAGNWTEIYPLRNLTSSYSNGVFTFADYISSDAPIMPKLGPIVVSFPVVPTEYYGESGYDVQRYYSGDEGQQGEYFAFLHGIPYGSQLDFQVEALVGHNSTYWYVQHPFFPQFGGFYEPAIAYDIQSDWSTTQTITIAASSASPTPTPTIPEYPVTIAITFLLVMTLAFTVIFWKKQYLDRLTRYQSFL
jgi:hypothetical protein